MLHSSDDFRKSNVIKEWFRSLLSVFVLNISFPFNYRDAVMEEMADRHVLSRNYAKWKIKYETEQKNGVASLNYK